MIHQNISFGPLLFFLWHLVSKGRFESALITLELGLLGKR